MTSSPSVVVVQAGSSNEELFAAFREERSSKVRWLYVLAIPLLGLLAAMMSMRGQQDAVRIVTAHGFRVVQPGMSQQDVSARLGTPIGKTTRADGAECFQYGVFSLTEPSTNVYVLCYVGGVLKDVETRRYSMWTADPKSGQFFPAGVPMGEEEAPKKAAPPAAAP
jgi:hypothetical protein